MTNDIAASIEDPEERDQLRAAVFGEIRRRQRSAEKTAGPRIVRAEKHCPRCQTTKPVSDFGVSRTRPDGRQGFCRTCR